MSKVFAFGLLILLQFDFVLLDSLGAFKIFKEWEKLNFDTRCLKNPGKVNFKSSQNEISGIKIYRNKIYLSIPRQGKDGVPVTMASISLYGGYRNARLQPFPSWEYQDTKNCTFLQAVLGFEIDPKGRMWVLDNGQYERDCPPKLIIFDLNTIDFVEMGKERNKKCAQKTVKVVKVFEFPEEVAPRGGTQLNDIVVDNSDGWFAYVSESGESDPGIIVYSLTENKCWKIRNPSSMKSKSSKEKIKGNGNINGIALTPPSKHRTLFYSPEASFSLYSLPTPILKNETLTDEQVSSFVRKVGDRSSNSDGIIMDSNGVLYFGLEGNDSLASWNPKSGPLDQNQKILASGRNLTWVDSFAFDLQGNLYFTTNHDPEGETTFSRIYQGRVGFVRSYMYNTNVLPFP